MTGSKHYRVAATGADTEGWSLPVGSRSAASSLTGARSTSA